jgi:hypothetical protein
VRFLIVQVGVEGNVVRVLIDHLVRGEGGAVIDLCRPYSVDSKLPTPAAAEVSPVAKY